MIYFIADVHIGNHRRFGGETTAGINQRCAEGLRVLREACTLARGGTLVVLGDLFDTPRPSPQIVAQVMDCLTYAGRVVMLVGNHDRVSDATGDTALAPFAFLPNVTVVERVGNVGVEGANLMCVPHLPGQTADSIEAAALSLTDRSAGEDFNVLCLHTGIKDEDTPPWLAESSSAIHVARLQRLAAAHGIALVISGDWHGHRRYTGKGHEVVQCGALVPTGFDNPGLDGYGTVVQFAPDTGSVAVRVLAGPRFVKGTLAEVVKAQATSTLARPLRATLIAVDAEDADAAFGLDSVVEVVRADVDVRAQAQQAAAAARSASTLDEALARYVREMPLPDGVKSAEVLASVKGYLARAGGTDAS